jgi:hypothetical protein
MNDTLLLVIIIALVAFAILGAMIHITLYITRERIEDDEQAEVESISVTSKGNSFDKKET